MINKGIHHIDFVKVRMDTLSNIVKDYIIVLGDDVDKHGEGNRIVNGTLINNGHTAVSRS